MARTRITGTRPMMMWGIIAMLIILIIGLVIGLVVIYPNIQSRADVEQHYQAGLAFESAEEWEAARQEYIQVIAVDAAYKDAQTRLAEVKARLAEGVAAATAVAAAQADQAQATALAEASAQALMTAEAQAQASATAEAALTAAAELLEQRYQRALGLINLEQWLEAQAELQAVFDIDPNYRDVQERLEMVRTNVALLTPTATPVPATTSTPAATNTPIPTPAPSVARSSSFDGSNTEGWTSTRESLTNPGAGGSGGGPNNGCLVWVDDASNTTYYVAPSRFLGDWTGYSALRLDLWSSGGEYFTSDHGMYGDIFLVSGFATAQRLLPHRPPSSWETFVILLEDDGQWVFGGGATSVMDVLVNVTGFQVRAEYGVDTDQSGLDNVELVK